MRHPSLAALTAALAGALALLVTPARAHLIAPQQGTVNLVGASAFVVLSVPTSSLDGVDDNADGSVDMREFQAHEAAIRAQIDRRLAVSDGDLDASTVSLDLVLSPAHGAASDRADQIVALKHARFAAAPARVRLRCDLFGARPGEREVRFTATRRPVPEAPVEQQTASLAPGKADALFFHTDSAPAGPPASPAPAGGAAGGALLCGAAFSAALGLGRAGLAPRNRRRRPASGVLVRAHRRDRALDPARRALASGLHDPAA